MVESQARRARAACALLLNHHGGIVLFVAHSVKRKMQRGENNFLGVDWGTMSVASPQWCSMAIALLQRWDHSARCVRGGQSAGRSTSDSSPFLIASAERIDAAFERGEFLSIKMLRQAD